MASSRFDASCQLAPKELWLMFWGAKRWRSMSEQSLSRVAAAVSTGEE